MVDSNNRSLLVKDICKYIDSQKKGVTITEIQTEFKYLSQEDVGNLIQELVQEATIFEDGKKFFSMI